MEDNEVLLPTDFDCYGELVGIIGAEKATIELSRVIKSGIDVYLSKDLVEAFEWSDSPQGDHFWGGIKAMGLAGKKWQEGEERMNNIGPNGNEGEHYEACDIDISEAVKLQNEAHDKRVLDSIKNSPDYEVVGSSHDNVNHPEHYQSEDGIECIDAIRASLGLDGFAAYCRGNAIKYAWRSGKKANHAEDLRKAAWYLEKAASELDR